VLGVTAVPLPVLGESLFGGFDNTVCGCALHCPSFRDHLAEPVDVAEHVIEVVDSTLELSSITLAVEDLHRVFDGKDLVEELRDRVTEPECFRSSWCCLSHARNVGTKAVPFKGLGKAIAAKFPKSHDILLMFPLYELRVALFVDIRRK